MIDGHERGVKPRGSPPHDRFATWLDGDADVDAGLRELEIAVQLSTPVFEDVPHGG